MAITHVDTVAARVTSNEVITVTAPTGIADNDLLIEFYNHNDNDVEPVTSSGFTQIESGVESSAGSDTTMASLFKIASSESGDYTISGTAPVSAQNTTGAVICLRGVDTSTPIDTTYVQASHYLKTVDNGGTTPQDIITTTPNAVVVLMIWVGGATTTAFSAPSGYAEIEDFTGSTTNFAAFTKTVVSPSTENPGAITVTGIGAGDECVMLTLAIRPAATGNPWYHYAQQ
jgi:hypothetical protein